MTLSTLSALSPLDGRYHSKMNGLDNVCSECGLQHARVQVEIRWLQVLSEHLDEIHAFNRDEMAFLDNIISSFSVKDAESIKQHEATTNHDVKAVEYFLKEKLSGHPTLKPYCEFIHFGCTSEDINNLAYGIILQQAREQHLLPALDDIIAKLIDMAHAHANVAMLSRTHGQAATPTTLGKEIANVVARVQRQREQLVNQVILGKCNGAVGNYNAHVVAYPELDWQAISAQLVTQLGLTWNAYTTQIEPHDAMAELFAIYQRINTILIDLSRDMWGYISLGYFQQQTVANEVGSSTMPHKVNPIDFENSEGNLGIANSLLHHFSMKLPISRWQRDLTDSTVLRNVGVAFGHTLLAYRALLTGLNKVAVVTDRINADLQEQWPVLAEAIQTVMRRYHIEQPYEKLKALTRGQGIDQHTLHAFIETLALPDSVKQQLLALTPATYLGYAKQLAKQIK